MEHLHVKIGLEIHQRLSTGKLFCRCPSVSKGIVKSALKRRLHVVKSELGEKDIAAQAEELKSKVFTYRVYDNSCLVECDEEPPHPINATALRVSIAVAKYMNMNIVDQVFVMRKTVIDGSNTSGFQRTAIVGLDGHIKSSKGDIGIQTLCIEEESSSIIDKNKGEFGLDRLGIPLIEIATAPDIKDGEHAREVAKRIGMLLRMTGKSARGIGTIRQDLNISIPNGARVEIKGVQELDDIPNIINNEIKRQETLLKMIAKLPDNPFSKNKSIHYVDVSDEFKEGKKWIVELLNRGMKAVGVKLPGLKGLLGIELCSGRRYGTELSDYAKSYGFGGLIHGDEDLDKYGVNKGDVEERMEVSSKDSYVILIGRFDNKMKLAFKSVIERAYLKCVPKETRRVIKNCLTEYMRPMATSARMYPETDIKPILIDKSVILESEKYAPRDPDEVLKQIEKETNKDLAMQLIRSPFLSTYYNAVNKGIPSKTAAVILVNTLKSLSREGLDVQRIEEDKILEALEHYRDGKITKKGIEEVLRYLCRGESDVASIISKHKLGRISGKELKDIGSKLKWDVKKIMSMHRMNVDAEELMSIIKKRQRKTKR